MSADYYQEKGAVARDAAGTDITEYITKTIEKYNEETGGWEIIGEINDPHENPWTVPHIDTTQPGAQYRIRYNVKDISNQPAEEVERVITIDRPSSMYLNYFGLRDDGIPQMPTNYTAGGNYYFLKAGGQAWFGEGEGNTWHYNISYKDIESENSTADVKKENNASYQIINDFGDYLEYQDITLSDYVYSDFKYKWSLVSDVLFIAYDMFRGMLAYRTGILHFSGYFTPVQSYGNLDDQTDDNYYSWLSENIENIRDLRHFPAKYAFISICLMGNGDLVGADWTNPEKMQNPPIIKSKIRSIVAADISRNGGSTDHMVENNTDAAFICEDFSRNLWWIYYDASHSSWGSKEFNLNIKSYEIQAITIHEQSDLCRIVLKSDPTKMYNYILNRSNYETKNDLTQNDEVTHDFLNIRPEGGGDPNIVAIYCSADFVLVTENGIHVENPSVNQYNQQPLPYSASILDDDKEELPGSAEISWAELFTMYEFDKVIPGMDHLLNVMRYVLKQEYLYEWRTANAHIFPAIYILCPSPVTFMSAPPFGAGVNYLQGRPQRSFAQETFERLILEQLTVQSGEKVLDMNPGIRKWNE